MTIAEAIQKLSKTGDQVYSIACKVVAVDEGKRTCDVQPLNGDADVYGVRLQSTLSDDKGICVFPKVDSVVVVTFINKQTGYVAMYSEIDKIEGKFGNFEYTQNDQSFTAQIGSQVFEISADAVKIDGLLEAKGNGSDLKMAIFSLLDLLSTATITTPLGPSTGVFDPTVIVDIQALKLEFAKFLK